MRPAKLVSLVLAVAALIVLASLARGTVILGMLGSALAEQRGMVERLGLTDLALFTEARYTRHPSQADLHSAFQDHPAGLEHFPTGSLSPPPHHLKIDHANLAGKTGSPD